MYFTIDQKLFSFNLIYIESWWMNGFKCIMAKRSNQVGDHKAIKQHSEKKDENESLAQDQRLPQNSRDDAQTILPTMTLKNGKRY